MNTKLSSKLARLTGMTIGLALFAGLAGEAKAQFKPASDDGIAASPRLRLQLNERNARRTTANANGAVAAMPCPKCKDEYITRTDRTARGANKPVLTVARHLCAGCETTITVTGQGKAKRDVATHKCNSCGAEPLACCSTTSGVDAATKELKRTFEVAPLK